MIKGGGLYTIVNDENSCFLAENIIDYGSLTPEEKL